MENIVELIKEDYKKRQIGDYLKGLPKFVQDLFGYLNKKEDSIATGMSIKYDNVHVRNFFHYAYRALYGAQYGDNQLDYKALFIKKFTNGEKVLNEIESMPDQYRMVLKNKAFLSIDTSKYGKGVLERITFQFPQIYSNPEKNVEYYEAALKKPESERDDFEKEIIRQINGILKMVKKEKKYDLGFGNMGSDVTVVWNRAKEVKGDYPKVAYIYPNGEIKYFEELPEDAKKEIEEMANNINNRDIYYTTAEQSYDGFGTREIEKTNYYDSRGKQVRKIKIPEQTLEWQTNRNSSGNHGTFSAKDFEQYKGIVFNEKEKDYDSMELEELKKLMKEKYGNVDISEPKSEDEKKLERAIANKLSLLNQEVMKRREVAKDVNRFNYVYQKGSNTIRTYPENYYVATVKDDNTLKFEGFEANTKLLNKIDLKVMWESGEIPTEEEYKKQLQKGTKVEEEHKQTFEDLYEHKIDVKEAIKETAEEHLKEDPKYYSKLEDMESDKYEGTDKGTGKLYEFFTPIQVVEKMWALAYHYGFKGGNILEPAIGSGRMLDFAPVGSTVTGFEINPENYKVAMDRLKKSEKFSNIWLYDKPFEISFLKPDRFNTLYKDKKPTWLDGYPFDLVIANPPYGKFTGLYKTYFKFSGQFEHFFIEYTMKLVKSGGLGIFIVPSSFMRNGNVYNEVKERIFKDNKLLDAYRLPSNIFEKTQIGTDIIVLQKK